MESRFQGAEMGSELLPGLLFCFDSVSAGGAQRSTLTSYGLSTSIRDAWLASYDSTHYYRLGLNVYENLTKIGKNVGFIGLGNMGSHMARNLITAGYKVTVHDINENSMKKFSDDGIPTKQSPLEVSESSDVVITMLPSSSHVLEVYNGTNGLLGGGSHLGPWLYIDSSTVDPQTSRKISTAISRCHLKENKGYVENPLILDAPVSGGVPAAEAAKLTFMVGGLEEAYLAAKPLLLSMGKRAIYCGGAGNGSAAKICNNMAMAISMLGVSEAFALGQNLGIKASTLTDIFNCSSARCWSSDTYNPVPGVMEGVPSSRNYDGGFTSKLMAKDLDLAMASASGVGFKCPMGSEALEIYRKLAGMAANSRTSHVYSAITMLARMKSDLLVTLANLPLVQMNKTKIKFLEWFQCKSVELY